MFSSAIRGGTGPIGRARDSEGLRLAEVDCGVVYLNYIHVNVSVVQELVHSLFASQPCAVVVDGYDSARHHTVVKRLHAQLYRFVPAAVHVQERDIGNLLSGLGNGIFEANPS